MINKEDYVEERCPFCTPEKKERIPLNRILEKLDGYFYSGDSSQAEKLLDYWTNEAKAMKDNQGLLSLYSEYVGLFRKIGEKEKCLLYCEKALSLLDTDEFDKTLIKGTTHLNVATGLKAVGKVDRAIEEYLKAEKIYKELLSENDDRFSALYNNLALCYLEKRDYKKAEELFFIAIELLKKIDDSKPEIAISYINLIDVYMEMGEKEKIINCLEKAKKVFESEKTERNYDYAYAIEKCADAFSYFDMKDYAECLLLRAKKIYEGN